MKDKESNPYDLRLKEIEQIVQAKQSCSCIRECGSVFEMGLRQLLQDIVQNCDDVGRRDEILAAERKVAKGNESFKKFGLGQLLGLYAEAKLFDKLKSHLKMPLSKMRRICWNDILSLRNAATHDEANAAFSADDALQMYFWLRLFLAETGLSSQSTSTFSLLGAPADTVCPSCKEALQRSWKFCPMCGTCVRLECAGCGETLAPRFKICPYCETPVRGSTTDSIHARHAYETLFRGAFLDKYVNEHERHLLEQKRLELGLSLEEAGEIERGCVPQNEAAYMQAVEGACLDGVITDLERDYLTRKMGELKIDPHTAKLIERGIYRSLKKDSE